MNINDLTNLLASSDGKLITYSGNKRVELYFREIFTIVKGIGLRLKGESFNNTTTLGILAKNSFEWVVADLACIWCGIKLFPLQKAEDIEFYSGISLPFKAVLVDDDYIENKLRIEDLGVRYISIQNLIASVDKPPLKEELDDVQPHYYKDKEVFSYKVTSGSTGIPKVIGQTVESVENSIQGVQDLFNHSVDDRLLVYLPLSLLQQRFWVYSAITYKFTVIIIPAHFFFIAIKQEKPTVIMGVPYIFELIREQFANTLKSNPILQSEYDDFLSTNLNGDKIFYPFKEYLGCNIKYLWTGSAPIASDTVAFFCSLGVPLYQGYGMNETCIASKCFPANNKIGSVGKAFPNVHILIDDESQVLVKSEFPVCANYTVCAEEDKQTFRKDGYIATGDIGYMDKDGYLYIEGRLKEMIVLSNSKKVYPSGIETSLRMNSEIRHCILYGDGRPYLVALIIPSSANVKEEQIKEIIHQHNSQARQENKIYRFCIRFDDLTDAITNQNKILRNKVYQRYAADLENLYN